MLACAVGLRRNSKHIFANEGLLSPTFTGRPGVHILPMQTSETQESGGTSALDKPSLAELTAEVDMHASSSFSTQVVESASNSRRQTTAELLDAAENAESDRNVSAMASQKFSM